MHRLSQSTPDGGKEFVMALNTLLLILSKMTPISTMLLRPYT